MVLLGKHARHFFVGQIGLYALADEGLHQSWRVRISNAGKCAALVIHSAARRSGDEIER